MRSFDEFSTNFPLLSCFSFNFKPIRIKQSRNQSKTRGKPKSLKIEEIEDIFAGNCFDDHIHKQDIEKSERFLEISSDPEQKEEDVRNLKQNQNEYSQDADDTSKNESSHVETDDEIIFQDTTKVDPRDDHDEDSPTSRQHRKFSKAGFRNDSSDEDAVHSTPKNFRATKTVVKKKILKQKKEVQDEKSDDDNDNEKEEEEEEEPQFRTQFATKFLGVE